MKDSEDELSPSERKAFNTLGREKKPPDLLEQRVVEALKQVNLIRPSMVLWRQRVFRIGAALAASLALFFLGVFAGMSWRAMPPSHQTQAEFMLVLRDSPEEPQNPSSAEVVGRIKEYSAWAREMQQEGLLVGGEKLKDDTRLLKLVNGRKTIAETQPNASEKPIAGYFLIRARDYLEAESIAEGCPHLKYGGSIEIRQIDSLGEKRN